MYKPHRAGMKNLRRLVLVDDGACVITPGSLTHHRLAAIGFSRLCVSAHDPHRTFGATSTSAAQCHLRTPLDGSEARVGAPYRAPSPSQTMNLGTLITTRLSP